MALAGFPWIPAIQPLTLALFFSLAALQALREDESPSFLSQFIQLTFDGRCAELLLDQEDQCSSATSGSR